jgi:Bacterial Ig domain
MSTNLKMMMRSAITAALTASVLVAAGLATAATTTVNLTAQRATAIMPDGASVPMWGYCATPVEGTACTSSAWSQGPTIVVQSGDTLQINLKNRLPVATSIVVLGQLGGGLGSPVKMDGPAHNPQTQTTWPGNGAPDPATAFTPPVQGQRVKSFAQEIPGLATDSTTAASLTWASLKPGTYIYETGTLPSIQAPMGLYGILIVTDKTTTPAQAYPATTSRPAIQYDFDTALLFSEVDPVQNAAVDAAAVAGSALTARFDDPSCTPKCYPAAVNYTPKYFLINGQSFDQKTPASSAFAVAINSDASRGTSASGNVLVRLLNAGSRTHVPSIVGLPMSIVAEDGHVAPGNPKIQNEVLLTAGKTHDVIVHPTATTNLYDAKAFAVFDRQLSLTAENQLNAGMLGFLQVAGGALPSAVTNPNIKPAAAVDDMFTVPANTSVNGNVRVNDFAVANAAVVDQPLHGSLSFYSDGSFVYTPASGATGTETFTYRGNNGTTNLATVTLNIDNVTVGGAGAPTANVDAFSGKVAKRITVTGPGVLGNDSDPANLKLTAALAGIGNCTSVTLNTNGSFTATGSGTCTFTYNAVNSKNIASAAPASVTVNFATGSGLVVKVVDPASNIEITDYRWIIQEDLTFKVDPSKTPAPGTSSLATSFHKSHMNVVATGCVGTMSCGDGQNVRIDSTTVGPNGTLGLRGAVSNSETLPGDVALDPAKHYYISVLPGDAAGAADGSDGHALGGTDINPGKLSVTINSNAYPWDPAQLSIFIYEDNAPVNGQTDQDEVGLGGFNIVLVDAVGRSGDVAGQQPMDQSGMPLSNWLLGKPGCPDDSNKTTNGRFHGDDKFVGAVYTCPNAPNRGAAPVRRNYPSNAAFQAALAAYNAQAAQDVIDYALAGHALIKNVPPARYDVLAHPGVARYQAGEDWWQTETLEGTQAQDAFTGVKEPVYFQEFGPPGFHTSIGFVNAARVNAVGARLRGTHTVQGRITNQRLSRPSDVTLLNSGNNEWLSSSVCQVALNADSGNGAGIAAAQCDKDGNFKLTGIPAGEYQMTIWDQWLDQIIQSVAVSVKASELTPIHDMGDVPVLGWFTQLDQNIYLDKNGNGKYDEGESGLSNLTMTNRYRDGGISNQTATDSAGNGLLPEVFPLFNWYVSEADTTRFKQTGVNVIVDGGGQVDDPTGVSGSTTYSSKYATGDTSDTVDFPGATAYGWQGFIGQRSVINWGRAPYQAGENGGIQGIVVYSTTRPFDDQRYNVQTLWEPLVPRVTVNLYRREKLADGSETLTLVDTTLTTSWDDFVNAADATGKQVNMNCPGQKDGSADPFVKYSLLLTNGSTEDRTRCYDGWHNWNQVQKAPYDGRYQFPSAAYIAAHPLDATCTDPNQCKTLVSLPAGDYVVEAVTPSGFEIVKEEDKNILTGDSFNGPAVTQFYGIGNVFILPDQATLNNANPFNLKTGDGIANNATSNLGVNASLVSFPECVGEMHRVPDYLSLFPATELVSPFAGMDRPLCDRKLVKLNDQAQASATFFVFTEVPMAANATGVILDDATAEYYVQAPSFGEKAAVPFVPVSMKDFNGREITRLYSDQWGSYNLMVPSSWSVNPPTPSGYGPNMLISCMNDPGPILVDGKMITDPQYNPAYSNFCYTFPYMPGRTTYLDTPVVPVAAYAAGPNPADCAYPDATPAISRVDSSIGFGPYVQAAGDILTITALGDQQVQNPAYAGPGATSGPASQRNITRHYNFGLLDSGPTSKNKVTVNGTAQTILAWSPNSIRVAVPAGTSTGELVITTADGKSTIDAATVTVGGTAPKRVQGANGDTIQAAIDAATPGDLILVDAGTYNELVVMWKPVRLQGVGASSVIINAAKYPNSKLEAWRPIINSLFSVDETTGEVVGTPQVDPLPGQEITGGVILLEPSVLATEQGAGVTVLAKDLPANQCNLNGGAMSSYGHRVRESNFNCAASRIDGLSVTGGDAGGGIYVNGWAHNLEIANNRVYGNAGAFNGGVRIGIPYLGDVALPTSGNGNNASIVGLGYDNNVKIHHNAITKNGTVESNTGAGGAGGGVSICSGSDGYSVDHNWICGNYSASDGGGIGHIGYSANGKISNNMVLFNQSLQQTGPTHGGGIIVTGEPAAAGGLSLGTGSITIDANIVRGNSAEGGHGGGIRLQQVNGADVALSNQSSRWFKATVTNNIIDNNLAGYAGGGISISDVLNTSLIDNNTVASNDSVGIAGVVVSNGIEIAGQTANVTGSDVAGTGRPSPAGISSEQTSPALLSALPNNSRAANAIAKPDLINNVVWKNRSFFYKVVSGKAALCSSNNVADATGATCNQLAPQLTTGQCVKVGLAASIEPAYWDLGVVGDTGAVTPGDSSVATLNAISPPTQSGGNNPAQRLVTIVLPPANIVVGTTVTVAGFTGTGNANYNGSHLVTAVTSTPASETAVASTTISYRPTSNGTNNAGFNALGKSAVTVTVPAVIGGPKLAPQYTVMTSTVGYVGSNNTQSDPLLIDLACNGARETPEFASGAIPSLPKTMIASATADEGNNYLTVRFGPLYLAKPNGSAFGDYHLNPVATSLTSSALDHGVTIASVTKDIDGDTRPQGAAYDIGADELVVAPAAIASITGGPLSFGNVANGVTSASQTLTLRNTGNANLTGISLAFSSPRYSRSGGTCGTTLTPAATCTIAVVFAPTASGLVSATLNVTANVAVTGSPVSLSGTGVTPVVSATLTPTIWTLSQTRNCPGTGLGVLACLGDPSLAFTLTNTGNVTLTGIGRALGGTAANVANYTIIGLLSTCGSSVTTLAPGATCVVRVQFKPLTAQAAGAKPATVTVTDSAGTQTSTLNGTAN